MTNHDGEKSDAPKAINNQEQFDKTEDIDPEIKTEDILATIPFGR